MTSSKKLAILVVLLVALAAVQQVRATFFLLAELCVFKIDVELALAGGIIDRIPGLEQTLEIVRNICQLIVQGSIEGRLVRLLEPQIDLLLQLLAQNPINLPQVAQIAQQITSQIAGTG